MTNMETEGSEDKTRLASVSPGASREHSPCFSAFFFFFSLPSEPTEILLVVQVGPTISLDFAGNFIGLPFSYSKNLKETCKSQ